MKNLILVVFLLFSSTAFSCHESYTTLVSTPTDIGGGQYSTTVQFCIGQTVNWGGTLDFTVTLNGANFVSYSPTNLSNTYNAAIWASCKIAGATQTCKTLSCISVTANASSTSTANVITYSTSSSVPAGWPLVPNDIETCGANSVNYCFNFTFVSDGYPTSVVLAGNIETQQGYVGCPCPFAAITQNAPCNGSYNPAMIYTFGAALPIELITFNGYSTGGYNKLYWITAVEIDNDFFTLERSIDGVNWEEIAMISGAGTSNDIVEYEYNDYPYYKSLNYYRLKQTDYNGKYEYHGIIVIDNSKHKPPKLIKRVNQLGQEVNKYERGLILLIYDNGMVKKVYKL